MPKPVGAILFISCISSSLSILVLLGTAAPVVPAANASCSSYMAAYLSNFLADLPLAIAGNNAGTINPAAVIVVLSAAVLVSSRAPLIASSPPIILPPNILLFNLLPLSKRLAPLVNINILDGSVRPPSILPII